MREVVEAFEAATGEKLPVRIGLRRAGDAAFLVADAGKLRETLQWSPQHEDLATMVGSALDWEKSLSWD